MSLDRYLIEHCAPTLASIKSANMFSCSYENEEELNSAVLFWNELFKSKGVELIILKKQGGFVLIYVCRKSRLSAVLQKDDVAQFLSDYGYKNISIENAINTLKDRLHSVNEFPHEIGIFLDYPLEDVKGFIKNAGANFKCIGCWKVYCNECESIKMFNKFKKCNEVYSRLYKNGERNIMQLTVKTVG